MIFERITNENHEMFKKAIELYSKSFPIHEQREMKSQIHLFKDEEYYFNLIFNEDAFVGLLLYWETDEFIYVEHFCILPEMRNCGYGQKVLNQLQLMSKPVILEIDPLIDAVSIRRKAFYERNGFVENSYAHIHPPYHKNNLGHKLIIMSFPMQITKKDYEVFNDYLKYRIMANVY